MIGVVLQREGANCRVMWTSVEIECGVTDRGIVPLGGVTIKCSPTNASIVDPSCVGKQRRPAIGCVRVGSRVVEQRPGTRGGILRSRGIGPKRAGTDCRIIGTDRKSVV